MYSRNEVLYSSAAIIPHRAEILCSPRFLVTLGERIYHGVHAASFLVLRRINLHLRPMS